MTYSGGTSTKHLNGKYKMSNTLTRKVLIEKSSPFWRYTNIEDVPDKLWDITFKRIENKNNLERIVFIVSKIICPVTGQKIDLYHISELNRIGDSMENRIITLTLKNKNMGELNPFYHITTYCYTEDISSFLKNGVNLRTLVIDYLHTLGLVNYLRIL